MVENIVYIGREAGSMPGESMCFDARIRYWEEEWLSQLLEEALRLKGKVIPAPEQSAPTPVELSGARMAATSE
jgi:hypothetical protein